MADYIAKHHEKYYGAFDLTANEHDDRSQVDDIRVTDVKIDEDSVTINYDVEYSAYHGCRDKNYADSDERELFGERQGRLLIFDSWVRPSRRSTDDEF